MGIYTELSLEHAIHNKRDRQYGLVYDIILDTIDIDRMCEIGVGGGTSHLNWLHILPSAHVCGVDVSIPVLPTGMDTLRKLMAQLGDNLILSQMKNSQYAMENFQGLPVEDQMRLNIVWGKNGADPKVAQSMGTFDFIVNDSKHRPNAAYHMMHWREQLNTNGVYVQEEYCGSFDEGFVAKWHRQIQEEVDSEYWRIFDFRHISTYQGKCSVLGVYTKNQAVLDALKPLDNYLLEL